MKNSIIGSLAKYAEQQKWVRSVENLTLQTYAHNGN